MINCNVYHSCSLYLDYRHCMCGCLCMGDVYGVCLARAWRVPRARLCLACCACLCSQFLGVLYFCPVLHCCCEIESVVYYQYILSRVIPFHACASSAVRSSIVLYNTTLARALYRNKCAAQRESRVRLGSLCGVCEVSPSRLSRRWALYR